MNFYNDNSRECCSWLGELVKAKHLPDGKIESRSIADIQPAELRVYQQCHFFAGIGGWPYALQLAGWPEEWPVWTGSCPCQPFSCAGKQLGESDERHLWPEFRRLISECRPATIFGEQVASAAGRLWLAGVRADLEALGYEVGASIMSATHVGAPHRRNRIYFVANTKSGKRCQQKTWNRRKMLAGGSQKKPWSDHWVTEPSVGKLVDGISSRVGRLRGYGNAIVPQLAAEFIAAFLDTLSACGSQP